MTKTITLDETDLQLIAEYKQSVEAERAAFKKSSEMFHGGEHEQFLAAHAELNKALAHMVGTARIIAARISAKADF
jgi:hypothetical protein